MASPGAGRWLADGSPGRGGDTALERPVAVKLLRAEHAQRHGIARLAGERELFADECGCYFGVAWARSDRVAVKRPT